MVVDIFIFNLYKLYLNFEIIDNIEKFVERFTIRKNWWKLDDDDTDSKIKTDLQEVEQLGFSTQFYFLYTIYTCGSFFFFLGIYTIGTTTGFNCFYDGAIKYIIPTIIAICILLKYFSIYFAKIFGIWKIKEGN